MAKKREITKEQRAQYDIADEQASLVANRIRGLGHFAIANSVSDLNKITPAINEKFGDVLSDDVVGDIELKISPTYQQAALGFDAFDVFRGTRSDDKFCSYLFGGVDNRHREIYWISPKIYTMGLQNLFTRLDWGWIVPPQIFTDGRVVWGNSLEGVAENFVMHRRIHRP